MNTVKWGILGCGRIAGKFASDLKHVADAELVAVASRGREKAQQFAQQYPARHIHDSYEALAANPEVDVIYIATPHSHHHEHAMLCLRHNKPVLCEKAFAINARQVREMITESAARKVFLMEAMWTRFLPHYNKVKEMMAEGKLGDLRSIQVNFGFAPQPPVPQRIYDPALGGGTLLDIGIYNVFLVQSLLGVPDQVQALMTPSPSGVDEQLSVQFAYRNGAVAQLLSTFSSNLSTDANIAGNKGRIRLTTRFYEPSTTIEFYPDKVDSLQVIPFHKEPGWGYQFQVRHVHDCLRQGLYQSPLMSHKDSLELMETMDRIREIVGLAYPADRF